MSSFMILQVFSCLLAVNTAARLRQSSLRLEADVVQVRKPKTDRRNYQYAVLDNGMKVMAVEDPHAAKSGFAVAVEVGSFYDPVALPGLAHFCEHLLFLGTKKYPDESSFDTMLSQHDGSNNAYTEQEKTVFYNEISHAGFDEGMDRFAQFFIAPLFKQEMVGRELNAVNSEHEKNVPDQGRRLWEIMRSTARNGSVVQRFYTGTTESLHHGDNATVAALKKYHSENYCAPRMNLVMVSNASLATQMEMAKKHFNAVERGNCDPNPKDFSQDAPFGKADVGQLIEMDSEGSSVMWMMFPMEPTEKQYKSQPGSVLQYLLAYAGPKSLKSMLKEKNLISDLNLQVDQNSATTLVFLTFDLTPKGAEDPRLITDVVFAYLNKVQGQSSNDLNKLYVSLQQMSAVGFDYQDSPDSVMDAVSDLAASVSNYAPEDILTGSTTIDELDLKLVQRLRASLSAENCNIALSIKNSKMGKTNKYEQWYRAPYVQRPIPKDMLGRNNKNGADGMGMPPALKYVPTNLVVSNASAGKIPKGLGNIGSVELWWLGKGRFDLPKAQLRIKLGSAKEEFGTAKLAALKRLHVEVVNYFLEEPMEDIGNCGMNWKLKDVGDGYQFEFDGYNQHFASLVEQTVAGFVAPDFTPAQFAHTKQKVLDDMADTTTRMPYEHAMDAISVVTTNSIFGREDVMAAIKKMQATDLADYISAAKRSGFRMQMLTTGNVEEEAAKNLAKTLEKTLATKGLTRDQAASSRVLDIKEPLEVRMANPIPGDANNAVVNAYQYGVPDVAQRVKILMLGKMISNPVYDTLRTKEQLGYVVFGGMMQHLSVLELRVIVQGEKEAPDPIDGKIEDVLNSFSTSLSNISDSDFHKWRASLRSSISRDDQNMGQEADRFWAQIYTDGHCFNKKEMALSYLDSFDTKAELAKEFDFLRGQHKKVSVRLFGKNNVKSIEQSEKPTKLSSKADAMTLVLQGEGEAQKTKAIKGQSFFATDAVCAVHTTK
jgi:insulysin